MNKDFLRQVFADEKKLIKKKAVDPVHMLAYDELSVRTLWPAFRKDKTFMLYFPDNFADQKGPSRKYFFDIMNTLYPEYLAKVMLHANEQRMAAHGADQRTKAIKISSQWEDELKSMPFLSCKYHFR